MTARFPLSVEERFGQQLRELAQAVRALQNRTMWLETGCAVVAYVGTIPASYTSGHPTVVLANGTVLGPCQYVASYTPTAGATVLAVPAGQSYIVVGSIT